MSYSCYQPSGAVPGRAYLFAALCFAAALPLSAWYAWLILVLPGFVAPFLCLTLAIALCKAVKHVCAKTKVRNPRWAGRFGLLLALSVWYIQWVVWTSLQRDAAGGGVGMLSLASQPASILSHAQALLAPASGLERFVSWVSWLAELVVLSLFPYFVGKSRAEEVFDEAVGDWAACVEPSRRFSFVDHQALLQVIHGATTTLSQLLTVETKPASTKYSRLRVYCRNAETALLSVVEVEEDKGKESVTECCPGRYLRVTTAELDELLADPSENAAESDPPELHEAIARLQAGDFQAAYEGALPFVAAENTRLYCDANRICAIVHSDARRWPEALACWNALFTREPTAHNALQVATSAVMAGEAEQGIAWAERARTLNRVSQDMPDVAIITGMLSALSAVGRPDAAMPFLAQLRDYYTHMRVTDPTFLFGHRMPLFHVFLEKSAEIVGKVLGADEGRAWYAAMLPHLDERGRVELSAWLDGAGAEAGAR